jgi:hypothetical protein
MKNYPISLFRNVFTLIVLTYSTSYSQLNFGLFGGLNSSNFVGSAEFERSNNFNFGGLLEIEFNKTFSVLLEPQYLQKAGIRKMVSIILNQEWNWNWQLNYIEIPILAKAGFGNYVIKPYLIAGPSVGFLLSANFEFGDMKYDVQNLIKTTDFSLLLGAGLMYSWHSINLFIDARYLIGTKDIFEGGGLPSGMILDNIDNKSRCLQFLAGLSFPII